MPHLWPLCFLVCASVRPSVPIQVKVFAQGSFDEVEFQSTRNLVHMFPILRSDSF